MKIIKTKEFKNAAAQAIEEARLKNLAHPEGKYVPTVQVSKKDLFAFIDDKWMRTKKKI
jgi:hypothetical protein